MPATIQRIQKPKKARALDTSGNNNHGQIYSGRALEFDGVSDYLDLGAQKTYVDYSAETTQANRAWTVACWIYLEADVTGTTPDHIIGGGGISAGYCCVYHGTNKLAIWDIDADGAGGSADGAWRQGNTALELKTWYRALWVFDGDETVTMYLNGVADGSGRIDTQTDNGDLSMRYIGAITVDSDPAVARLWNGKLADLQLWQGAFTADDALYDYNNPEQLALNRGGTSLTNSNLKAWYPMNDGHRGQQSYILDASNTGLGDEMITSDWDAQFAELNTDSNNTVTYPTVDSVRIIYDDGNPSAVGIQDADLCVVGTTYKIVVTVTDNMGTPSNIGLRFQAQDTTIGNMATSGTYTFYWTQKTGTNVYFYRKSTGGDVDMTINSISIKPVNDKNHATTVFYGDELIDTTADRDMSGSNNWDAYNGGTESVFSGLLRITVDGGGTAQGAQLSLSDMGNSIVAGRTYRIQADLDFISGSDTDLVIKFVIGNVGVAVKASDGSPSDGTITTTAETYYADVVAGDATGALRINCSSATNNSGSNNIFTVDNVSVKEVGTASGWTDADQQLHIPQTALQSYNQLAWFDGGANVDYAETDSAIETTNTNWSLSFWLLHKDNGQTYDFPFGGGNTKNIALDQGTRKLYYREHSGGTYHAISDAEIPQEKWVHIVITATADTSITAYVNGEAQTTNSGMSDTELVFNRIMMGYNTSDYATNGSITEISYFASTILTASQVNTLYNDGKAYDVEEDTTLWSACTAYWRNNGLSEWKDRKGSNDANVTAGVTETMLITAGVDGSRDSQGFLMNRQRTTNSLNNTLGTSGGKSYVEMNVKGDDDLAFIGVGDAFSISLWVKARHLAGTSQHIISRNDETDGYRMGLGTTNKLSFEVEENGNKSTAITDSAILVDTWYHMVGTFDGDPSNDTSGVVRLYLNGVTGGATTNDGAASNDMDATTDTMYIGRNTTLGDVFDGEIDDLCIYDKVLTQPEVTRNYNAGKRSHR